MIRSSVFKASLAVAAGVTVVSSAAMISPSTTGAQLSPAWEASQLRDIENMTASNSAVLQAEKERKAKARALAKKRAAEAAAEARARAAAERRAKAAEAARAARGGTPAQNRALGMRMCADHGWSASQCADLGRLWDRESGWSSRAHNGSSGAHGIPQALPGSKMASHGSDWATSARTQIAWGLDYIADVYGNPSNAWAHSQRTGWY
jgi:membrane protein involved in colicin uptake